VKRGIPLRREWALLNEYVAAWKARRRWRVLWFSGMTGEFCQPPVIGPMSVSCSALSCSDAPCSETETDPG